VVRGDPGWRVAAEILERDSTDTYGRLEAWENVASVTFADDIVEVHITGHYDESEGESELYFQCEDENPGDDAAAQACFEERQADLSPPEHWERTVSFRVSLGGIADF
jgi:hypothetical protein